jgi:TFIIF-interacting CTD phosphatase-like protein
MVFTTVVLDLDKCLVYSKLISEEELIPYSDYMSEDTFAILDPTLNGFWLVKKRAHLDHFVNQLKLMGKRIVIWNSGSEYYTKQVVEILFNTKDIAYTLTSKHLVSYKSGTDARGDSKTSNKKPLSLLNKYIKDFTLEQTVLIDDIISNGIDHPRNTIVIKQFLGERDDELLRILTLLSK